MPDALVHLTTQTPNDASLTGIFEINSTPTYKLQHYCEGSENVGDRLGVATASGENEIYSTPHYSANSINFLKNFSTLYISVTKN